MSFEAERAAIEGYFLLTWAGTTPIAWEGVPFTPPAAPWVRLSVRHGAAVRRTIGASEYRFPGTIIVQVHCPPARGSSAAAKLADRVAGLFREATINGAVLVQCREASLVDVGPTNEDYQVNVAVSFWRDEVFEGATDG